MAQRKDWRPIRIPGGCVPYVQAVDEGIWRASRAMNENLPDALTGRENTWPFVTECHVVGALGEQAYCLMLGMPWNPDRNGFGKADLPGWEIKASRHPRARLRVYSHIPDDRRVGLAIGAPPVWYAVGWILAGDGKRDEWRSDLGRGYWVPQAALVPVSLLP